MKRLILGGARSGKSTYAEALLAGASDVDYIATSPERPDDPEWVARIELHRARRPANWRTLEAPDLPAVLAEPGPPVLIDCIGVWLTTQMDTAGIWDETPGADERLRVATEALLAAWCATERDVIAVTNEVGLGLVPATPSGRRFRDDLGRLNMALAASADEVWFLVAGLPWSLK